MPRIVAPGLIAVLLMLVSSDAALACSCRGAPYGFAAEGGSFLPSNAKGLLWYGGSTAAENAGDEDFLIFQIFGEELHQKKVTVSNWESGWKIVAPREEMNPGNAFMFIARHTRNSTGGESDKLFETLRGQSRADRKAARSHPGAVQAFIATFPLELKIQPKLAVEELKIGEIDVAAGSICTRRTSASLASLRLAPVRELEYFKDHLLYTTVVDGKETRFSPSLCTLIPPGRSWREVGQDTLYSDCGKPAGKTRGLAPGAHEVQMRVVFPAAKDGPISAASSVETFAFAACPR